MKRIFAVLIRHISRLKYKNHNGFYQLKGIRYKKINRIPRFLNLQSISLLLPLLLLLHYFCSTTFLLNIAENNKQHAFVTPFVIASTYIFKLKRKKGNKKIVSATHSDPWIHKMAHTMTTTTRHIPIVSMPVVVTFVLQNKT